MEDNTALVGSLVFVLLLGLILSGMFIAFAMLLTGLITLLIFTPDLFLSAGFHLFNSINNFVLVAIPMFVFMGHIILESGLSERLYRGISKIVDVLPGSLIHTNIVGCTIFAAISGSATGTAVTIGTVAIPEQINRNYDRKIILGSILCGGTLGVLIPPSIPMIVYGAFVGVSVARLFIAGFVPGLCLSALFISWVSITKAFWPAWTPTRQKLSWGYIPRVISSFKDLWPFALLMTFILGSIYTGVATPTECAAVGAFIAVLISLGYRNLTLKMVKTAGIAALRTSCFVMVCIIGGRLLGIAMGMLGLPRILVTFVSDLGLEPMMVWILLIGVYLFLGMLMDDLAMLIVSLPVVYPLMTSLGFDPVWLGVMLVIMMQVAMISPPVGVVLYVVHGISMGTSIGQIMLGSLPFVVCILIGVVLFTAFPQLVLWLPSLMF